MNLPMSQSPWRETTKKKKMKRCSPLAGKGEGEKPVREEKGKKKIDAFSSACVGKGRSVEKKKKEGNFAVAGAKEENKRVTGGREEIMELSLSNLTRNEKEKLGKKVCRGKKKKEKHPFGYFTGEKKRGGRSENRAGRKKGKGTTIGPSSIIFGMKKNGNQDVQSEGRRKGESRR